MRRWLVRLSTRCSSAKIRRVGTRLLILILEVNNSICRVPRDEVKSTRPCNSSAIVLLGHVIDRMCSPTRMRVGSFLRATLMLPLSTLTITITIANEDTFTSTGCQSTDLVTGIALTTSSLFARTQVRNNPIPCHTTVLPSSHWLSACCKPCRARRRCGGFF